MDESYQVGRGLRGLTSICNFDSQDNCDTQCRHHGRLAPEARPPQPPMMINRIRRTQQADISMQLSTYTS